MQTLKDGLLFPECPRWHNNELWFSDMHANTVYRMSASGELIETIAVPGEPAGLGWLPNGELLVVSMRKNRLYRYADKQLHDYADLSDIHPQQSNDMVVDSSGNAYIGNFGFDIHAGEEPCPTRLALVDSNGRVSAAADGLLFPNGMVIADSGKTLVVAESFAAQLSAYPIAADGSLGEKRVWAQLGDIVPDGICLDSQGCIWVAACVNHACVRVREGGEILATIATGELNPFACMLGGSDGKRLFMCNALDSNPEITHATRSGRIDYVDVAVAAAGGLARP